MRIWWFYDGQVPVPLELAKEMKLEIDEIQESLITKTKYASVTCKSPFSLEEALVQYKDWHSGAP